MSDEEIGEALKCIDKKGNDMGKEASELAADINRNLKYKDMIKTVIAKKAENQVKRRFITILTGNSGGVSHGEVYYPIKDLQEWFLQ